MIQLYVAEGVTFCKVPGRGWRMGFRELPLQVHKNCYSGALLTAFLIIVSLLVWTVTLA